MRSLLKEWRERFAHIALYLKSVMSESLSSLFLKERQEPKREEWKSEYQTMQESNEFSRILAERKQKLIDVWIFLHPTVTKLQWIQDTRR